MKVARPEVERWADGWRSRLPDAADCLRSGLDRWCGACAAADPAAEEHRRRFRADLAAAARIADVCVCRIVGPPLRAWADGPDASPGLAATVLEPLLIGERQFEEKAGLSSASTADRWRNTRGTGRGRAFGPFGRAAAARVIGRSVGTVMNRATQAEADPDDATNPVYAKRTPDDRPPVPAAEPDVAAAGAADGPGAEIIAGGARRSDAGSGSSADGPFLGITVEAAGGTMILRRGESTASMADGTGQSDLFGLCYRAGRDGATDGRVRELFGRTGSDKAALRKTKQRLNADVLADLGVEVANRQGDPHGPWRLAEKPARA